MGGPEAFSKLPRDDAYWASLEARMASAAIAGLGAARTPGGTDVAEAALVPGADPWHAALARRATTLGVLAAAAALVLVVLPPRADDRGDGSADDGRARAAIGALTTGASVSRIQGLLGAEAPPALAALLVPAPEAR